MGANMPWFDTSRTSWCVQTSFDRRGGGGGRAAAAFAPGWNSGDYVAYHLIGPVRTPRGMTAHARTACPHVDFRSTGWVREDRPFDSYAAAVETDVETRIGYDRHGCHTDPIRGFPGRPK